MNKKTLKIKYCFQVEEESSEILKRIDPEDLGIAVDAHGNQTVVVTSVQGKKHNKTKQKT